MLLLKKSFKGTCTHKAHTHIDAEKLTWFPTENCALPVLNLPRHSSREPVNSLCHEYLYKAAFGGRVHM